MSMIYLNMNETFLEHLHVWMCINKQSATPAFITTTHNSFNLIFICYFYPINMRMIYMLVYKYKTLWIISTFNKTKEKCPVEFLYNIFINLVISTKLYISLFTIIAYTIAHNLSSGGNNMSAKYKIKSFVNTLITTSRLLSKMRTDYPSMTFWWRIV